MQKILQFEGGSSTAYTLNTLFDRGWLVPFHLTTSRDSAGGVVYEGDGIRITREGVDSIREMSKWWTTRAIEQQPVSFLLVVLFLVNMIWTGTLAYYSLASKDVTH